MKKICILLAIGFLFACSPKMSPTGSQNTPSGKKHYKVLTVAFYNLENLFDTINDPTKQDEKSPIMDIPKAKRGEVYWKKNHNMAKVISKIGADVAKNSPAVIGVAEVENKDVLEDLVNDPAIKDKNYGIIHYDSPDYRGIDVALLYQKKLFKPISSSPHEVVIYNIDKPEERHYTRDELLVSGLLDGDTIHFIVNHWPSRYGGEKRSRVNREKAAALNIKIIDSLQALNPYAKIITMGDLNDGPYNSSIQNVLKAKANKNQVPFKGLFDPMINMQKKKGLGTLGYRDSWDLFDQIIMTKPLLSDDYSSYRYYKAGIYNPNYLTNQHGRYKGYPFWSYSNGMFTGGYSDHYPVYIYLIKEVDSGEDQ